MCGEDEQKRCGNSILLLVAGILHMFQRSINIIYIYVQIDGIPWIRSVNSIERFLSKIWLETWCGGGKIPTTSYFVSEAHTHRGERIAETLEIVFNKPEKP